MLRSESVAGGPNALTRMPEHRPGAPPRSCPTDVYEESRDGDLEGFVRVAAPSGFAVLITGETGSGKTFLARSIHQRGPRAQGPFVRINCAAIPEALFEREMFGNARGAYTDAREAAEGFLEAAHGGTLFLDEASELAPRIQPKLLAVLEDGRFRRLGASREIGVDVRVIAAANRDLARMVAERQFREDLYYRLSVLRYTVRPLRERLDELPRLAREILERNAPPGGRRAVLSPRAADALRRHSWPGNIRELENALRSAIAFSGGGEIRPEHLPPEVVRPSPPPIADTVRAERRRYEAPLDPESELRMIHQALARARGNKSQAARSLGMSRSTLWAKLVRYGDLSGYR